MTLAIFSSGTKCLIWHSGFLEKSYWMCNNIHESVDPIIINITSDEESEDDDDDVFLDSENG